MLNARDLKIRPNYERSRRATGLIVGAIISCLPGLCQCPPPTGQASQLAVTLTDGGPISSGNTYTAGDNWQISIQGPDHNAPVSQCDQNNFCTPLGLYGNTDVDGNFALCGTFASNDQGSWSETWYVGSSSDIQSNPSVTLTFYVNPAPPACDVSVDLPSASLAAQGAYDVTDVDEDGNPIYTFGGNWIQTEGADVTGTTTAQGCTLTDVYSPINPITSLDSQYPYFAPTQDTWQFGPSGAGFPNPIVDYGYRQGFGMAFTCGAVAYWGSSIKFIATSSIGGTSKSATVPIELELDGCFGPETP